jgi:4'-phosphopantetheinyl transferase
MDEESVYWLLHNETELPQEDDWLSDREKLLLQKMKLPKRRGDWKLGRWTAKRLIRSYLKNLDRDSYHFADLEVFPAEDGSPQLFIQKKFSPLKISISHRAGAGLCAINPGNNSIGCDLEIIEERSDAFVSDYFTFEEKLKVIIAAEEDKALIANLIWSAKESALKTLHRGLKSDTRSIVIQFSSPANHQDWNQLKARSSEFAKELYGWWKVMNGFVLTIMTDSPTAAPIVMENK